MISQTEFNDRLDEFRRLLVQTSAVGHAIECLNQLMKYGDRCGGGRFMLLSGESRSGKSHLAEKFRRLHPPEDLDGRIRAPVVYVELAGKTTEASTPSQILRALGDVQPSKGTIEEKHTRIIAHIRDLGVKLLIVDEAHHLVERKPGQPDRLYAATEQFKYLLNNSNCSIVFAGLPAIQSIADVNPQFAQRTVKGAQLPAYNEQSEKQRREYGKAIKQLCREAPLDVDSELLGARGVMRFHTATRGLIGNLSELLWWSAINAYENNEDRIGLRAIAKTYEQLGLFKLTRHNVFAVR